MKNIGNTIGKGLIHDGRYVITQSGHTVRIETWCHDGHAVETYKINGVTRDHFDDGQIGNLLKDTVNRMARMNAMMRKFGVDRMAPVVAPVLPSKRKTLQSATGFLAKYKASAAMSHQYYIKNGMVYGQVTCKGGPGGGYRYLPFNSAQRASRKAHATAEAAVNGRVRGGRLVHAENIAQAQIIAQGGNPV